MDYEAEDKGILRKITTEALSRVMQSAERNDMRAYNVRITETDLGELRMAMQGADILYRESATDWTRRNFFNLLSMIKTRIAQLETEKERSETTRRHMFETFNEVPFDIETTWCKHCNTTLWEIPAMHFVCPICEGPTECTEINCTEGCAECRQLT